MSLRFRYGLRAALGAGRRDQQPGLAGEINNVERDDGLCHARRSEQRARDAARFAGPRDRGDLGVNRRPRRQGHERGEELPGDVSGTRAE